MNDFWGALNKLVAASELVIDRPKGSRHPRYTEYIYPLDFGYLADTTAMDGGGIDVWRGSKPEVTVDAIICVVDLVKRDSEIKVLIGCTQQEQEIALHAHNYTENMKGMLVRNPQ